MTDIHGQWQPGCEPVVEAFANNFAHGGEEGAALSVIHRGKPLINIYAGQFSNRLAGTTEQPWQADTRVNIFSAGKPLVAVAVLRLIADGQLKLDDKIADIWSEFAANGKADITLRHVLAHRSGVSAFHERIADAAVFDWQAITTAIAAETPWFEVNSGQGYSPFVYGWILGEVVRRVTGASNFYQAFQTLVAAPGNCGAIYGLADAAVETVADIAPLKRPAGATETLGARTPGADSASLGRLMKSDPRGITNRAFANPMSLMMSTNTREWRQAQIPAANAHASAADLANFYSALLEGKLLPEEVLALCWQEQSAAVDQVLGVPLRFACGCMLTQNDRPDSHFGRGTRAFGHPGAGGTLGFADPEHQIGFGYVTSRVGQSVLIDDRAIRLIDALYELPEIQA
jgi:CubicO group peptidase (beta-lactamase class C family)